MTETEAIGLFKCLADATRLQILKSLAREPMYVELLAQRLERTPSTISFHLKKLEEAGLVVAAKEQYYTVYSIQTQPLSARLMDVVCQQSGEADAQEERERRYRQKVLDSFFEYGKLKSIPVQRKKRLIILERLAEDFQPGRVYPEREVNLTIADHHDDFCTIRREMIAEGLMARDATGYWLTDRAQPDKEKPAAE